MRKLTTQDKFSLFYPLRMCGEANPFPRSVFSAAGTPGRSQADSPPPPPHAATEKVTGPIPHPTPPLGPTLPFHFFLLPPPSLFQWAPFPDSFTSSTEQLGRLWGGTACARGARGGGCVRAYLGSSALRGRLLKQAGDLPVPTPPELRFGKLYRGRGKKGVR